MEGGRHRHADDLLDEVSPRALAESFAALLTQHLQDNLGLDMEQATAVAWIQVLDIVGATYWEILLGGGEVVA